MIGLLTIASVLGVAFLGKRKSISGIGRNWYGGNSGYDGYSMSVRARNARSNGKFPKVDFKKIYHVSEPSFNALRATNWILNSEWHHTSKYGNRTEFYEWGKPEIAEFYLAKKKIIDKLSKEKNYDEIEDMIWDFYMTL